MVLRQRQTTKLTIVAKIKTMNCNVFRQFVTILSSSFDSHLTLI